MAKKSAPELRCTWTQGITAIQIWSHFHGDPKSSWRQKPFTSGIKILERRRWRHRFPKSWRNRTLRDTGALLQPVYLHLLLYRNNSGQDTSPPSLTLPRLPPPLWEANRVLLLHHKVCCSCYVSQCLSLEFGDIKSHLWKVKPFFVSENKRGSKWSQLLLFLPGAITFGLGSWQIVRREEKVSTSKSVKSFTFCFHRLFSSPIMSQAWL